MQTTIMKKMLPYLLTALVLFYGVPGVATAVSQATGDPHMVAFVVTIFSFYVINSAYCFASCFLFQWLNGFRWYYPVLLVLLFVPVFPALMQSPVEPIFLGIYAVAAGVGTGLSALIRLVVKRKNKHCD